MVGWNCRVCKGLQQFIAIISKLAIKLTQNILLAHLLIVGAENLSIVALLASSRIQQHEFIRMDAFSHNTHTHVVRNRNGVFIVLVISLNTTDFKLHNGFVLTLIRTLPTNDKNRVFVMHQSCLIHRILQILQFLPYKFLAIFQIHLVNTIKRFMFLGVQSSTNAVKSPFSDNK